jgi:tetratricopeptide (TPR) repeat protein
MGKPKEALADRDRAVLLKPEYAETHLARADSYLQLGMSAEEMTDRDETIHLAPDWPEAWLARGRSFFLRGEYPYALRDLNKVLELKPDDPEAKLLLVRNTRSGGTRGSQPSRCDSACCDSCPLQLHPRSRNPKLPSQWQKPSPMPRLITRPDGIF